jgi:hypothetical protein
MGIVHLIGRIVLAVVLIAGFCGDALPGSTIVECTVPTPSSDADEEAGEGFVLVQPCVEPILSWDLQNPSPQAPSSVVIHRIPHVPKPVVSL